MFMLLSSYSVESAAGIPLGCIIRALPDSANREDFSVESIDQLTGILSLTGSDELVGNIIKITHAQDDFKVATI